MSRITRVLAVSSLGVIAGLTLAAPAQAASASVTGSSTARAGVTWHDDDNDRVVGVYRSYRACEWAGERGERRGAWDDYDCNRVRRGWHRSAYELEVSCDNNGWNDDWDGDRRHGHRGHRGWDN